MALSARSKFVSLAALAIAAPVASGVVVDVRGGSLSVQQSAPAGLPQWNNVGTIGSATGVYLGNGYVLTAAHVGAGTIHLPTGTFAAVPGSAVQLSNGATAADLIVYRVAGDVGLPTLNLAASTPAAGTEVYLIGNSVNQSPDLTHYARTGPSDNFSWTVTTPDQANTAGYSLTSGNTLQWGTNTIGLHSTGQVLRDIDDGVGLTRSLVTTFDASASPTEAQAVSGDSGGAMFDRDGNLVGLLYSISTFSNQPSAGLYGQSTYAADVATYRPQILSAVPEPATATALLVPLALLSRRRR